MRTLRDFIVTIIVTGTIFNTAWAGPPFITDDPEPAEYQHWEINYAASKSWRQGEASAGIPSIDINYGISSDVQLHVQPKYSYERAGRERRFGFDDTEVGIKYRLLNIQNDDASLMVAIYPMLLLPTGDARLGADRGNLQSFLPLWVQTNSDKWTIYGGVGYRLNRGTGNKNSLFLGGAALYQVNHSLQLGGELFHESPDTVEGKSITGFNLGGSYNLAHDYNFLFSAGREISYLSSIDQTSAYLALQVLY